MIRQVLYKQLDNNAKTLLYDGGGAFFFKTPNYRGVQFFSHRCKAPGGGSDSTNKKNMRPKTMKTKLLQGTVAPSRIKTFSGSAVGGSLLELSDAEQGIYKKLQDHLLLHNAGKEIDDIFLTISARAIGHLLYNAEVLAGSGAVMIHPNGARQVSAEWTAFKQSMEMFMDLSRSLGLDPGSRLKLDYFRDNTAEQDDEIAKLLKLA